MEQIRKRKINIDLIEKIVMEPQQKLPDKDDYRREIRQSIIEDDASKQKILRVVTEETEFEIIAVTAYISSRISKYWSKDEN